MSTIRKAIFINRIEPAPLSFRCGTNVDTLLEVTYYAQESGNPWSNDVDGQLRLTGRSTRGISKIYSVPAIDVANGIARAVIPAGDVKDVNGYALSLYGSIAGEAALIARGLVFPDEQEEPMPEPTDVIDVVPMTLEASLSTDTSFTVKLWDDESKGNPYDIGSATVSAPIQDKQGGITIGNFTVTPMSSNSVQLTLTQAQIALLPASCWWLLTIGNADGRTTLCEGPVTVNP